MVQQNKPDNGITMLQSKVGALTEHCEYLTLQNAELQRLLAIERERTDRAHNSQQEAWRRAAPNCKHPSRRAGCETLTREQEELVLREFFGLGENAKVW